MSLRFKFSLIFLIVFFIIGLSISIVLVRNLELRESINFQEESTRLIKILIKELFIDFRTWQESQTVVGPYGFEKTGVKEKQEQFLSRYQEITGRKMILTNIYNDRNTIIASSFKELEGLRAANPSVEAVLKTGEIISEIEKPENIHSFISNEILKKEIQNKRLIEVYQPIVIENKRVGVVETYVLLDLKLKEHLFNMLAIIGLGFLLTIIIIYFFFNRFILGPILIIRKATEPVGHGEFAGYINGIKQKDEIGGLADDFNLMIRGLNSLGGEIGRLKDLSKIKSEFISIAAHQLRTPLTGIKWSLETLLEKAKDEDLKKWAEKINELNERMIRIISDFLNAARIEEGRFGYEFQENIELISMLDKIIGSFIMELDRKKIGLLFDKTVFRSIRLKADPEKIEIVFQNIMDNAVKYTPAGGNIKIEVESVGGYALIKIQDSGIGIPDEEFPRVFGKFFRAKNAIGLQPSGSGIGLFIAKNIVDKHQGQIWFESEPNKGSVFYVKLPIISVEKQ